MHVCTNFEPECTGFTVYTAPFHTGLLFVSPPKRSDFHSPELTGLLRCSVTAPASGMKIATLRCNSVSARITLYRINFHSDGKIRGCLHYTASFRSEIILPIQKQVLTAVIYRNIFKTTILS